MNTPRTNEALAALLERDGELSEENAPEVLVKLCKELETEAGQLREQVERSQAGATVWHRRCFGEDPKWGDTKDAIVGKAVALVKFWEEQGGGNGVMARAKEDALILACGSLHNAGVLAQPTETFTNETDV